MPQTATSRLTFSIKRVADSSQWLPRHEARRLSCFQTQEIPTGRNGSREPMRDPAAPLRPAVRRKPPTHSLQLPPSRESSEVLLPPRAAARTRPWNPRHVVKIGFKTPGRPWRSQAGLKVRRESVKAGEAGRKPHGPADSEESAMAGRTGFEPATSGVTGQCSNQLNYRPTWLWPVV